MNTRRRLMTWCWLSLALACTDTVRAETRYVTDQLQIGIHEDKTLDSVIIELLPTGTALEVLVRDGGLAQVETPNGTVGWVDAKYLATEVVPKQALKRLRALAQKNQQERDDLRARTDSLARQLQEMEQRATAAEADLVAASEARSEAEALSAQAEAQLEAPIPSDTLRDLQRLAVENQRLKQQLVEIEAQQLMVREHAASEAREVPQPAPSPVARPTHTPVPGAPYTAILYWPPWQWILLGASLLLCFALGTHLMDWRSRKRHGGFRV